MSSDSQMLLHLISPETIGGKKITRKRFPDESYILYSDSDKKKKVEISIPADEAEKILTYYKTDKFIARIDPHSGVLYMFPSFDDLENGNIQLYGGKDKKRFTFSVGKKKTELFKAIGNFRRMFVVLAISENHLLIVPNRKHEKNEYTETKNDAQ